MNNAADTAYMQQAQALAEQAMPACRPNPAVGCVLADAHGQVLGRGHTQPVGGAHAEVMALRDAQRQGHSVAGATVYVTLEPCAHHGRTPPCCDALIAAGVRRVVAAVQDPHPQVAGQGIARLRAAGIQVDVGLGAQDSRELNLGFFSRMERGRPWVRVKAAASLDGRTALPNGVSQWITGEAARADGHRWRARADAVLTGIGTVLADDPRLDVRGITMTRQPALVIVDSRLRTPPGARLWQVPRRRVLLYAAHPDPAVSATLRELGAEVVCLARSSSTTHAAASDAANAEPATRVKLHAMLQDLSKRAGIGELHVEAGAILTGALWQAGLVDELLLYQAPMLLGSGAPIAAFDALTYLAQAPRLHLIDVQPLGHDLRLVARISNNP